jgi:2-polyprenyl-3-methyl-5-hydroxy-6-metoxy-1,4-benzoquinol methylase
VPETPNRSTADAGYAHRLSRLQSAGWKQALDVQRPYRWHLRHLQPGFTLDVGCGIGRSLEHLGGNGVGVDHNGESVAIARSRGFTAFTPEEFAGSEFATPARFDALLSAHVVEHMSHEHAVAMLREYLPYVRIGGQVVLITPQEAGFRSDATHVTFVDFAALLSMFGELGVERRVARSFPFPRVAGRWFKYNEFVVVGELRAS